MRSWNDGTTRAGLLLTLAIGMTVPTGCKRSRADEGNASTTSAASATPAVAEASSTAAPDPADSLLPDDGAASAEVIAPQRWVTHRDAGVRFAPPEGYRESRKGDWALYAPTDGSALIAFTTFTRPNESTAKLGAAAQVLGVTGVDWGQAKSVRIGAGDFPSRIAGGKCDAGGPASIAYATINPGGTTQVLFVYFVKSGATKQRNVEVKGFLRSLQRA